MSDEKALYIMFWTWIILIFNFFLLLYTLYNHSWFFAISIVHLAINFYLGKNHVWFENRNDIWRLTVICIYTYVIFYYISPIWGILNFITDLIGILYVNPNAEDFGYWAKNKKKELKTKNEVNENEY